MRLLTLALLTLALASGCGPTNSEPSTEYVFLGTPETQERTLDNGESPLRGVTVMTKVEQVDPDKYVAFKNEGKITAEERRGGVVYFAVRGVRHVPVAGGNEAAGAYVDVTERYKATVPE